MRTVLFFTILAAFLLAPVAALAATARTQATPIKLGSAMSGGGMGGGGMGAGGMRGGGMGGVRPPGGGALPAPEPSGLLLFASSMAITAGYVRTLRKKKRD